MVTFFRNAAPPWASRVLVGERVRLRAPRQGDWASWAQVRAESREFLAPWEPTWSADALTRTAFRRRLRRYQRDAREESGYAFVILGPSDEAILGGITLTNVRTGVARSCAVGYWMGKPYARQGYMTDTICALLPFVFEGLRLHRLEAACISTNIASQKLLRRCGFCEEGLARQYLRINGVWEDHLLFALLASDPRGR